MRPGWRTTEFWATVLVVASAALSALAGWLPAEWAAVASAIASGLYATSRGLAKQGGGDAALRKEVLDVLVAAVARHGGQPGVPADGTGRGAGAG